MGNWYLGPEVQNHQAGRHSLAIDPAKLVSTAQQLADRVHERFPDRTLNLHARAFASLVEQVTSRGSKAVEPPKWMIAAGWIGGFGAILLVLLPFWLARRLEQPERLVDSLQTLDSGITIVAGAIAGYFTMRSITTAHSRRCALVALQELRQVAHVTDMLQSNKAPAKLLFAAPATPSSRPVEGDPASLARYLVYCGELHALVAKVAILYGLWVPDAAVLSAAGDVEDLCAASEHRVSMKLLQLDLVIRAGRSA